MRLRTRGERGGAQRPAPGQRRGARLARAHPRTGVPPAQERRSPAESGANTEVGLDGQDWDGEAPLRLRGRMRSCRWKAERWRWRPERLRWLLPGPAGSRFNELCVNPAEVPFDSPAVSLAFSLLFCQWFMSSDVHLGRSVPVLPHVSVASARVETKNCFTLCIRQHCFASQTLKPRL